MLSELKQQLIKALYSAGVTGEIELVVPPKSEMGEFAFGCFTFAQKNRLSPPAVAKELSEGLQGAVGKIDMLEKVEANGPYVNFYLNNKLLAERVLNNIKPENKEKNGKKVLIEFAQPNTHKAFHIGHLRGTITGESLSRVMEAAGYDVVRANYQGDVGMHIAKCLWGILQIRNLKSEIRKLSSINEKIKFLGDAYVAGATAFESDEKIKKEIEEINNRIYGRDLEIKELYDETRAWSLEYFDGIYKKLDTHFDRFFFESEVYKRASQIVNEFLPKGVFAFSENAIIYRG
ncbi:MAG: arginine--tRNA ligase, partial [Candidatus Magasanikbacteria bacterium RIFOXYB2_FULL_40_13]